MPLALLALVVPARADLPAAERWISSDRLAVGVAEDGSLVNRELELGLVGDPDGPEGTAPVGGDLIFQGWAVEAWLVDWEQGGEAGGWMQNAAHYGSDVTLSWETWGEGPDAWGLHGAMEEGADGPLAVETWISVGAESPVLLLTLRLEATEDLESVRVARLLDLDPDAWLEGEYSSLNASGDGYAAASGAWDGRTLAMTSAGGVGAVCAWCEDIDTLLAGAGESSIGDEQIGVVVEVGALAAGESVDLSFAYAFALDLDEAQALALAATLHDADGDGVYDPEDCGPGDAGSFAGASQSWNGQDDDCDGEIDEETAGSDDDGDGFTEADGDCDDTNVFVFPGAEAVDGVADADCDGADDDGSWAEGLGEGDLKVEPTGCGCAHGARGGWLGALAALALAGVRAGGLRSRRLHRRLRAEVR